MRGDVGQEFGHYPTREAAELVAQEIAREREADLVVHTGRPTGDTRMLCTHTRGVNGDRRSPSA